MSIKFIEISTTLLLVTFLLSPLNVFSQWNSCCTVSSSQGISFTTTFVDQTFAEGRIINTNNNSNQNNAGAVYIYGATVNTLGGDNETRRYEVVFDNPHPDGSGYVPIVSAISNEPNGDEFKVSVIEGSVLPNGFEVITTLDDNGGTEDPQTFGNWQFNVTIKVQAISSIDL